MHALPRFLVGLLTLLLPMAAAARPPELAAPPPEPATLCETAVGAAEYTGRLPPRLLGAIARVESGRPDADTGRLNPWPWTINADGAGAFFASKQQAIDAVKALQARGVRSIDVGCLQVNLMYHPNAFASLDDAFDPRTNARYAARFLNALYADSHDWLRAVAAYHSQTPALGADYRQRVVALWHNPDLAGWHIGLAAAYRDFAPRSQVYGDFAQHDPAYGAFAAVAASPSGVLSR
jgi:soluble lytic murein transglycosylase-like protein